MTDDFTPCIRKFFDSDDLKEISDLMYECDGYKIVTTTDNVMHNIWFRTNKGSNTELFLKSTFNNGLIISRISITNQHRGYGTKIIETLEKYAKEKSFDYILVESTLTKEICNLCEKLGYEKQLNSGIMINNIFCGNWSKKLN